MVREEVSIPLCGVVSAAILIPERDPPIMVRTLSLAVLLVAACVTQASELAPSRDAGAVSLRQLPQSVTLADGFVQLTFDRVSHRLTHLAADHTGRGQFRQELLAPEGLALGDDGRGSPAAVSVLRDSPQNASVALRWTARGGAPVNLTLSLGARERGVHLKADLPAGGEVRILLRQWFLMGLFDRGAVQYVGGQQQSFTSTNPLRLFYTMDRANGSVALAPDSETGPAEVSLVSGAQAEETGIVLRPQSWGGARDAWLQGPPATAPQTSTRGTIGFTLFANDLPYPAHREDSRVDGLDEAEARDRTAYFTAAYGSAAGALGSYFEAGSAYPTLAHPTRPYGDAFNFFDPDSWETVTVLAWSGDPLLQAEARKVLERSEAAQRSDGQIPHHFDNGKPTYLSIAGSSQTGPNIFWTLAATEYAAATGG
jgi:hypothetical protein